MRKQFIYCLLLSGVLLCCVPCSMADTPRSYNYSQDNVYHSSWLNKITDLLFGSKGKSVQDCEKTYYSVRSSSMVNDFFTLPDLQVKPISCSSSALMHQNAIRISTIAQRQIAHHTRNPQQVYQSSSASVHILGGAGRAGTLSNHQSHYATTSYSSQCTSIALSPITYAVSGQNGVIAMSEAEQSVRQSIAQRRSLARRVGGDDIPDPSSWNDPFMGEGEIEDIDDPSSWLDPFSGGPEIEDIDDPESWIDPYMGEHQTPIGDLPCLWLAFLGLCYCIAKYRKRHHYDVNA